MISFSVAIPCAIPKYIEKIGQKLPTKLGKPVKLECLICCPLSDEHQDDQKNYSPTGLYDDKGLVGSKR